MPQDPKQGAQTESAQQAAAKQIEQLKQQESNKPNRRQERLDVAAQFAAAIIGRGQGRTPDSLAREVIKFTDAFLTEFDKPQTN